MRQTVRALASLLFVAAVTAHLGPAGPASLGGARWSAPATWTASWTGPGTALRTALRTAPGTAPVCAHGVGPDGGTGSHVLFPAAVLDAPQAEGATDGGEPTGGRGQGGFVTRTPAPTLRLAAAGAARRSGTCVPSSLLGFPGNPTTAPPLQA